LLPHDVCSLTPIVAMRRFAPFILFACAACSWSEPAPPVTPARPAPVAAQADTLSRLHALVGAAACTDSAQCRAVAVGSKPCGGPEYFLAWSSTATASGALTALAERYRNERVSANAGVMGDCRVMPEPGAICRAGHCVLRPQGSADPS
jgi:hypothetical protein